MTERQIINRAKKIKALEEQKKAIEQQIDSLKAEIQEEMKDQEVLEAGDYTIRWTTVNSERFDSKAFKAAHKELFSEYVKTITTRRFQVFA